MQWKRTLDRAGFGTTRTHAAPSTEYRGDGRRSSASSSRRRTAEWSRTPRFVHTSLWTLRTAGRRDAAAFVVVSGSRGPWSSASSASACAREAPAWSTYDTPSRRTTSSALATWAVKKTKRVSPSDGRPAAGAVWTTSRRCRRDSADTYKKKPSAADADGRSYLSSRFPTPAWA